MSGIGNLKYCNLQLIKITDFIKATWVLNFPNKDEISLRPYDWRYKTCFPL